MAAADPKWKAYFRARAEWFKGANTKDIKEYDRLVVTSAISGVRRPAGDPPKRKRRKKSKAKKASLRSKKA